MPVGIQVRLDQVTANGSNYSSMTIGGSGMLNARLKTGEHKVSINNLPSGYSIESARSGSCDLMANPLIVDAKSGMARIEVVLK
jgi:hypothetical protein